MKETDKNKTGFASIRWGKVLAAIPLAVIFFFSFPQPLVLLWLFIFLPVFLVVWFPQYFARRKVVCGYLLFLLLLFVLPMFGLNIMFEFFYYFFLGWIPYLMRVIPQVTFNAEIAIDAAILLALATLGLHGILRWWATRQPEQPAKWRFNWTVKISAMVLLLFATSVAATGIVHQTGWLFAEKHLVRNAAIGYQTRELSDMKQVGLAMRLYASDHNGKFPPSLNDLFPDYLQYKKMVYSYSHDDEPPEPMIYYSGYDDSDASADVIVLSSPRPFPSSNGDRRVIVHGDSSGVIIPESEFQLLMKKQETARAQKQTPSPAPTAPAGPSS